jgi:hypothetical protein
MAHEMEPVKGASAVPVVRTADDALDVPTPWYPQTPVISDRPEWLEARPPFNPESDLERYWSNVMYPIRCAALAFMWLTYAWYRFAIAAGSVFLLVILFQAR